jgi:hypothetical protein
MERENENIKTAYMTQEKLVLANHLQDKIYGLQNQLDQIDEVVILPGLRHPCDSSLKYYAQSIDKKVRTYLKSTLTQELNKAQKEFEKL